MNHYLDDVLNRLDEGTKKLFLEIDSLVYKSISKFDEKLNVKLWQKAPLYYFGDDNFKPFKNDVHQKAVHILPFNGHINIFADGIKNHIHELSDYKITPKASMLQLYLGQLVPIELLMKIFEESLL